MKIKLLIAIITIVIVGFFLSLFTSDPLIKTIQNKINTEISKNENNWIKASFDELSVSLSGTAPNQIDQLALVKKIEILAGQLEIINKTSVAPTKDKNKSSLRLELIRDGSQITVIGLVPNLKLKEKISNELNKLQNTTNIDNFVEVFEFPTTLNFDSIFTKALWFVDKIAFGKVEIIEKEIRVLALISNNNDALNLKRIITKRALDDQSIILEILSPNPIISPFVLVYNLSKSGGNLERCSAGNLGEEKKLLTALQSQPLLKTLPCSIGGGSPSPNWTQVVISGIKSLQSIGSGSLLVSDLNLSLTITSSQPGININRKIDNLRAELPDEFTLNVKVPNLTDENLHASEWQDSFIAVKNKNGLIILRGQLQNDLTKIIILAHARATFGPNFVNAFLELNPDLPIDLASRIITGITALKTLYEGEIRVAPNKISINGTSSSATDRVNLINFVKEKISLSENLEINIIYDATIKPTKIQPTPKQCVNKINAILKEAQIKFEPASTEITGSSRQTVKKIADIMKDCEQVVMEISGHTDSQGREQMNLGLSQLRAEAVKSSILSRRVLVRNLIPKGYGESQPIADNKSETGREMNRRIAFKLLKPVTDPRSQLSNSKDIISNE